MNYLFHNHLFNQDIDVLKNKQLPWSALKDSSINITGATGLIGRVVIDVIMTLNIESDLNCNIFAVSRNKEKAELFFSNYFSHPNFKYYSLDVNSNDFSSVPNAEFIIHAASNTHPMLYSTDPIGTILTNVLGLTNVLQYAVRCHAKRTVFLSSVEIYGESRTSDEVFSESSLGYIDCNTLRAGYSEGKRLGESLCQAYISKYDSDIVIARLARIYGPTINKDDTKAVNQFLFKAVDGDDIILKSDGSQFFSFLYVADAVSAIFYIMLKGKCGEAYNVSDKQSDIHLFELASMLAKLAGTKVIYDIPSEAESKGYSKATRAIIDSSKLKKLGWMPDYDISRGIERTFLILQNGRKNETGK